MQLFFISFSNLCKVKVWTIATSIEQPVKHVIQVIKLTAQTWKFLNQTPMCSLPWLPDESYHECGTTRSCSLFCDHAMKDSVAHNQCPQDTLNLTETRRQINVCQFQCWLYLCYLVTTDTRKTKSCSLHGLTRTRCHACGRLVQRHTIVPPLLIVRRAACSTMAPQRKPIHFKNVIRNWHDFYAHRIQV